MTEILNLLFHPLPNAIMSFLMGFSLLYWLITMLLGDGFDFGDSSVDMDIDGADIPDVDAADAIDGDVPHEPSFLSKTLDFINIGKAPLMVIVTVFKFIGWLLTLASSLVFNLAAYGWKSIFILIPVIILSYLLLHYITIPLVKLYKNVGYMGEEALEFLGRSGKMRSTIQGDSIGAAEFTINSDVIRLHVKSTQGEKINYDEDIIIISKSKDDKYYFVERDINLNNIHS